MNHPISYIIARELDEATAHYHAAGQRAAITNGSFANRDLNRAMKVTT